MLGSRTVPVLARVLDSVHCVQMLSFKVAVPWALTLVYLVSSAELPEALLSARETAGPEQAPSQNSFLGKKVVRLSVDRASEVLGWCPP